MKLSIDSGAFVLLARVSHFLAEQGIASFLTGGFVRDVLLERDTADLDIALAADALKIAPELARALSGKFILLDAVNGVGRVVVFEPGVPPARGRWEIDLTTIQGNLEQDLGRRDFTVNAMAVDLRAISPELGRQRLEAQLIDPFGGLGDLRRHVIRAVAETAFTSDAVRLMRAVRLAAELGFSIDGETELMIRRHHQLIATVAAERVREELLRLLAQNSRFPGYLDELGLLTAIVPELTELKGVQQPEEHYWDVFEHSVETVAAVDFLLKQGTLDYAADQVLAAVPWSETLAEHFALEVGGGCTRRSLLKLAALLHDIAKPQTKAVEGGRIRFLGHAQQGAAMAAGILQRLRFSAREVRLVEAMVRYHLRPGQLRHEQQMPSHRAIYRYFRDTAEAGVDTLFLSLADHLAARGPHLIFNNWQEHAQMVDYILTQHLQRESLVIPPKLIDGHDLLNIFGLSPGPRIGELLESVREAQAASEVTTRQEALDYIRERLSLTGRLSGRESC